MTELEVAFITHQEQYHWAMLLVKGDMYWLKGYPSGIIDFMKEYIDWEEQIAKQYQLNDEYIYGDLESADYESGILDNAIKLISNNNHSYASTRS